MAAARARAFLPHFSSICALHHSIRFSAGRRLCCCSAAVIRSIPNTTCANFKTFTNSLRTTSLCKVNRDLQFILFYSFIASINPSARLLLNSALDRLRLFISSILVYFNLYGCANSWLHIPLFMNSNSNCPHHNSY